MKKTRNLFAIFAMSALAAICGFAQTPATPANPSYDADLARKLGANDYGLRQYIMCVLKTGPLKVDDAKRAELMRGHFGMITRLANEGKLVLAGPFTDGGEFRGIYIFDVPTIEAARALTETDPSIKEGYFKVEFLKWNASAALMQVNETHKKIARVSP